MPQIRETMDTDPLAMGVLLHWVIQTKASNSAPGLEQGGGLNGLRDPLQLCHFITI